MKRLKDNQPGFKMNSGKFSGKRYERGVGYNDSDIPDEHKDKFMVVKKARPVKATGNDTKEEKSK